MTIILELTPEEESKLNQAAAIAGLKPADLARKLIIDMPVPVSEAENHAETTDETPAVKRTLVGYGILAHLSGGGVEALHEERTRDKERENREFED